MNARECIEKGYSKCIECGLVEDLDEGYLRELHESLVDSFGSPGLPSKLTVLEQIVNIIDPEHFNKSNLNRLYEDVEHNILVAYQYLAGAIIREMENFKIIRQPVEIR